MSCLSLVACHGVLLGVRCHFWRGRRRLLVSSLASLTVQLRPSYYETPNSEMLP